MVLFSGMNTTVTRNPDSVQRLQQSQRLQRLRRLKSCSEEDYMECDNDEHDQRLTSAVMPYEITDVAYFVANPEKSHMRNRLGISISPGKKDLRHNRTLSLDLERIKDQGIQTIVCLLEWSEMKNLGIADYPRKAQEQGLIFYHLPIKDRGAPQQKEVNVLVPIIAQLLSTGQNVLIHCRAGLGRAGTICACCLLHFGYDAETAMSLVRRRRQGAIQTPTQERCILDYYKNLVTQIC